METQWNFILSLLHTEGQLKVIFWAPLPESEAFHFLNRWKSFGKPLDSIREVFEKPLGNLLQSLFNAFWTAFGKPLESLWRTLGKPLASL